MFYLYLKGQGDGCDYTIGCNEKLIQLRAASLELAKAEAAEKITDRCDVNTLAEALLFEAKPVNLGLMMEEMRENEEKAKKIEEIESKRAHLARLKRELEE